MYSKILTIVLSIFFSFSQVFSQDVDEIINKTIAARGDVATYKNLNTLIMSGSQSQMGMNIPFKLCIKKVDDKKTKYYLESEAMGSKQQMGSDGDTLWANVGQLQIVPKDYAEQFISQIAQIRDFAETPLLRYKEKGHKIELSGSVNEDGRDSYTLRFIQKDERESILYIDKNNYELFKIWAQMTGQNNEDIEIEMNYSNYKMVNGFSIPHKMVLKMGDYGTMDVTLEKVDFNPVIDDAIFNVPKEEKKAE